LAETPSIRLANRIEAKNIASAMALRISPLIALGLLLLSSLAWSGPAEADDDKSIWFTSPPDPPAVNLYFFWSSRCPHCLEAKPFIEALPVRHEWIKLSSHEIFADSANRQLFVDMAAALGFAPTSVPTFMWCGTHVTGFGEPEHSTKALVTSLAECYRTEYGEWPSGFTPLRIPPSAGQIMLPGLGEMKIDGYSLPALAVILGGLDAFNPCAFFVLLFLLSLLVNTRSRARMLLIGGVFVLVSGLVYFAFMAAWLNLFRLLGGLTVITLIAGLLAMVLGSINIKDYFHSNDGVSLSLSTGRKARLFARMRALIGTGDLPTLLFGTLTLAVAANTYELLCTAGLPMVFTRILTMETLPTWQYYAYLGLYNLVYILPLAIIVLLFVFSMGRRKLTEQEGRFLKLLSGTMMLSLGVMLVFLPEKLSSPHAAVALILLALVVSFGIRYFGRRRSNS